MLVILLIFLIVIILFAYFVNRRSFFSPTIIVSSVFLISDLAVLTNWDFFGREDISFYSFIIIFLSLIMLLIGELMAISLCRPKAIYTYHETIELEPQEECLCIRKIFVILICIIAVAVTIARFKVAYSYSVMLGNREGIWKTLSYVRRYVNSGYAMDVSRLITYPAVLVKAGALYCAYIFAHNKVYMGKSNFFLLLPMILYSIYTLTGSARTGVIEMGCAFLVMYYVFLVQKNDFNPLANKKIMRLAIIVVVLLAAVFVIAGNMRAITNTENTASDIINYTGSSLIVFSRWLENYELSPFPGYATAPALINILNKLGIVKVSLSHSDIYSSETVLANSMSNLKTWLKAPIQDFTVVGMLFTRIIIGFVFEYWTMLLVDSNHFKNHPGKFIFVCMFFYILISASLADRFDQYIQLETIYMAIIFSYFKHRQVFWNALPTQKIMA